MIWKMAWWTVYNYSFVHKNVYESTEKWLQENVFEKYGFIWNSQGNMGRYEYLCPLTVASNRYITEHQ